MEYVQTPSRFDCHLDGIYIDIGVFFFVSPEKSSAAQGGWAVRIQPLSGGGCSQGYYSGHLRFKYLQGGIRLCHVGYSCDHTMASSKRECYLYLQPGGSDNLGLGQFAGSKARSEAICGLLRRDKWNMHSGNVQFPERFVAQGKIVL